MQAGLLRAGICWFLVCSSADLIRVSSQAGWPLRMWSPAGSLLSPRMAQCSNELRLSIVWHLSSRGIIFQDDVEVQDLGCFHHAGLATGILPALARMHAGGFSVDASHLVAQLYSLPSRWVEGFALVRCSIDGSHICL